MPRYRLPPNLIRTMIPHLASVTSLALRSTISHDDLSALASVRSIKSLELDLRMVREDVDHPLSKFRLVCSGAFSHLRSLSLESGNANFWCLSDLTYLTGLSLILVGSGEARLARLSAGAPGSVDRPTEAVHFPY
jgi:hypothetical protein